MPENSLSIVNFLDKSGLKGAEIKSLPSDASYRHYARIKKDNQKFILMIAPPEKEDVRPFLKIGEILRNANLNAPEIFAKDINAGLLLLEDFGDDLFSAVLRENRGNESELYAAAIKLLEDLPKTADIQEYSRAKLIEEVSLFTDWFATGADKDAYINIWQNLLDRLDNKEKVLVLRDYHADNLVWLPERAGAHKIGLLDFQDAVIGHPAYDLVSLLEDARRDVDKNIAAQTLKTKTPDFLRDYFILAAQRNCKIIGIFNRLKKRDGKDGYLKFLPRVWAHLRADLEYPALAELKKWMEKNVPA